MLNRSSYEVACVVTWKSRKVVFVLRSKVAIHYICCKKMICKASMEFDNPLSVRTLPHCYYLITKYTNHYIAVLPFSRRNSVKFLNVDLLIFEPNLLGTFFLHLFCLSWDQLSDEGEDPSIPPIGYSGHIRVRYRLVQRVCDDAPLQ